MAALFHGFPFISFYFFFNACLLLQASGYVCSCVGVHIGGDMHACVDTYMRRLREQAHAIVPSISTQG